MGSETIEPVSRRIVAMVQKILNRGVAKGSLGLGLIQFSSKL